MEASTRPLPRMSVGALRNASSPAGRGLVGRGIGRGRTWGRESCGGPDPRETRILGAVPLLRGGRRREVGPDGLGGIGQIARVDGLGVGSRRKQLLIGARGDHRDPLAGGRENVGSRLDDGVLGGEKRAGRIEAHDVARAAPGTGHGGHQGGVASSGPPVLEAVAPDLGRSTPSRPARAAGPRPGTERARSARRRVRRTTPLRLWAQSSQEGR